MKKVSQIIVCAALTGLAVVMAGCSSSSRQSSVQPLFGNPITVFGPPLVSSGKISPCPGSYKGYIIYAKTNADWGWAPSTNTTIHTASDGSGRTDTKINYLGEYGDPGCQQTTVTVPSPTFSPKYRFVIYFPNNVPTTNYPIILNGFDP